jgi:hypothetical protein
MRTTPAPRGQEDSLPTRRRKRLRAIGASDLIVSAALFMGHELVGGALGEAGAIITQVVTSSLTPPSEPTERPPADEPPGSACYRERPMLDELEDGSLVDLGEVVIRKRATAESAPCP